MVKILLDVDGVLSMMPRVPDGSHPPRRLLNGNVVRFGGEVSNVVDVLRDLGELYFFTLWNGAASSNVCSFLQLDFIPHFETGWGLGWDVLKGEGFDDEAIHGLMFAKIPLIKNYVGLDEPFVFFDDMVSVRDARYLKGSGFTNFMLVRVDPERGLGWNAVDLVHDFVDSGFVHPSGFVELVYDA